MYVSKGPHKVTTGKNGVLFVCVRLILFGVQQRGRGLYDVLNKLLMMSLSITFGSLRPDNMLELSFLCRR